MRAENRNTLMYTHSSCALFCLQHIFLYLCSIPVNLRAAIYCHAMRTTDGDQPNILQFMLERINRAASSHERARIIDAFFCTLTEYRVEDDVEEDANNTHDTHDDDDDYYDEDDDDDDAERRDANEVQIELTDRHLSSMLPHRHAIDIGVGTKSLPPRKRLNYSARRASPGLTFMRTLYLSKCFFCVRFEQQRQKKTCARAHFHRMQTTATKWFTWKRQLSD